MDRLGCFSLAGVFALALAGCSTSANQTQATPPFMSAVATLPPRIPDDNTPPPEKTGGFDGKRAFAHVVKQVSFGPRPAGSQSLARLQDYLQSQLTSYGCSVDTDAFSSDTPAGRIAMKNIIAKVPGERPGIIILATHYDTKRIENFVGADDGGSSTGVMLELARLLCGKPGRYQLWIAFLDGEEAVNLEWKDPDNRYGSREMAAKMSMSGDLSKIRAFLLADMVGTRALRFRRESNSTPALTDLLWNTAAKLGYGNIFVNEAVPIEDDHISFLKRGVPCVDVIDFEIPYWHTTQDTIDKISSTSLAVVGHVFIESVRQLQSR
jgi:hypothetical protein